MQIKRVLTTVMSRFESFHNDSLTYILINSNQSCDRTGQICSENRMSVENDPVPQCSNAGEIRHQTIP